MVKHKAGKAKPKTNLWRIGWWATLWWAVSCLYAAWLIWQSRETYALYSLSYQSTGFFSDWSKAISNTYSKSSSLKLILGLIILIWLVGGVVWLIELKKHKIRYRSAFKDLLLTIRK